MSGPIKPSELKQRSVNLPEKVFEAFNELIALGWNGSSATVMQDAAASRIAQLMDIDRSEVFDRHYLDIEQAYRNAGWSVDYDKPGYNETYEASFVFRKKGSR